MPVLPARCGAFLRSRHRIPKPRPDVRSRPTEFRRRAAQRSNLCTPVVVINVRTPSVRRMIEDKQTAAAIDKIVSRMRDVIDELAFDERRQVLLSIRAISGDIADRLEAPSSRNH